MDTIVYDMAFWLAPLVLVPVAYAGLYAYMRMRGVLCVSREGWHAKEIVLGAGITVPAVRLFTWFQPLLRNESRLRRRLAGKPVPGDASVSEVVVELVPMA